VTLREALRAFKKIIEALVAQKTIRLHNLIPPWRWLFSLLAREF